MYALINGIYQISMFASGFFVWLYDFGAEHLGHYVHIFYMCKETGYDLVGSDLVGYAGLTFGAMLVRFLWNALRGAGA